MSGYNLPPNLTAAGTVVTSPVVPPADVIGTDGAPAIDKPTVTSTAERSFTATGAGTLANFTSVGSAWNGKTASGSPSITIPNAIGVAVRAINASGSPILDEFTTTSSAHIEVANQELPENSYVLFVHPNSGSDSYNGRYATPQGGSNGPWKTPNKVEASATAVSSSTHLVWLGGANPGDRLTMPNSYIANANSHFQFDTYYMDGSVPKVYATAFYTDMADWNQGVIEPERYYFNSYVGTSDDHPSTSRRWSVANEYIPVLGFTNCRYIDIRNQRIRNYEGRGLDLDNTENDPNNYLNYQNPIPGQHVYNLHINHGGGEGMAIFMMSDLTIEHCFIWDVGRLSVTNNAAANNIGGISIRGSRHVKVLNNDICFVQGEAVDFFAASIDCKFKGNWVYAARAVTHYWDTSTAGVIIGNVLLGAPTPVGSSIRSTWTKDSVVRQWGTFEWRGEGVSLNAEEYSFASWVNSLTARPANVLITSNIICGLSQGVWLEAGSLAHSTDLWENIHIIGNVLIANGDGVRRDKNSYFNFSNHALFGNIILDGGEVGLDDVQGDTQGLVPVANYFENGPHTGWTGAGDLDGGDTLTMTKTSGYRDIVFQNGVEDPNTNPRYWGFIRSQTSVDLLNLSHVAPQSGSATIDAGTAVNSITVPNSVTVATQDELRRDVYGFLRGDPIDMGAFEFEGERPPIECTGSPTLDKPTSSGVASRAGEPTGFGNTSITKPTASGVATAGGVEADIEWIDSAQTAMSGTDWNGATIPSSAVVGDIAFALITDISETPALNSLSGWTQIGSTQGADSTNILAYRVLQTAEVNSGYWDFTSLWSSSKTGDVTIAAWKNQNDTPLGAVEQAAGYVYVDNNIVGPTMTSSYNKSRIIQFVACDMDASSYDANPAGTPLATKRASYPAVTLRQWAYIQDYAQDTAGSIALEIDVDQSDTYSRWQVELRAGTASVGQASGSPSLTKPTASGSASKSSGSGTVDWRDGEQTAITSSSTTWTFNIPAAAAAGDIALVLLTTISGGNDINTTPSGWTKIGNTLTPGSDSSNVLLWKELSSADITAGSFTFTNFWNNSDVGAVTCACWQNPHASAPIDANNDASGYVDSTVDIIGPSITPSNNNCTIVQLAACDPDTSGYSGTNGGTPAGTERMDQQDVANRQWIYIHDYQQTTAAAISLEINIAQSDTYARWQVALRPA